MTKQKKRKKRRIIVAGGVAAAGTGAAAAARAQRKRPAEPTRQSLANSGESRMHPIADRAKSRLNVGKEKLVAVAHKVRHPSGTKPA